MVSVVPLIIYDNLLNPENLKSNLHKIGGVYGIMNISDPKKIKQYIGSSLNLYQRLLDHLKGRDSNSRLQRSIKKYGIENFNIAIYYFHNDPSIKLTDIETKVIKSFTRLRLPTGLPSQPKGSYITSKRKQAVRSLTGRV